MKYTEEQFIEAVKSSFSCSEVCRKIGISPKGGNLRTVKNKILKLNLDYSHFTGQRWNKGKTAKDNPSIKRLSNEEFYVKGKFKTSNSVRQRLLKDGLKEYKCERCKRSEWEGAKIPLELHHINGDHWDNRLENLQILCPNCHALTDNYSGKKNKTESTKKDPEKIVLTYGIYKEDKNKSQNCHKKEKKCPNCGKLIDNRSMYCPECAPIYRRKVVRPSRDLLKSEVRIKSFVELEKKYGVSDRTISRWCEFYKLPFRKSDINKISDKEWEKI